MLLQSPQIVGDSAELIGGGRSLGWRHPLAVHELADRLCRSSEIAIAECASQFARRSAGLLGRAPSGLHNTRRRLVMHAGKGAGEGILFLRGVLERSRRAHGGVRGLELPFRELPANVLKRLRVLALQR